MMVRHCLFFMLDKKKSSFVYLHAKEPVSPSSVGSAEVLLTKKS